MVETTTKVFCDRCGKQILKEADCFTLGQKMVTEAKLPIGLNTMFAMSAMTCLFCIL